MNPKEQPDKEGEQDEINPETGKSYFDGLNAEKLTRPAPTEKENWPGGEDKQDELWYAVKDIFFNHLEYNNTPEDAVKELKSKYSIKRNQ